MLGKEKPVENVGVFPPWWRDRKQGKKVLNGKGERGKGSSRERKQGHEGKGEKKKGPKGTGKKALKGKV